MNNPEIATLAILEGEGNTVTSPSKKQGTERKYYCFTVHNYEADYDIIIHQLKAISNKGIVGKEICPTTGKKHLQGYIELKKKTRITALKIKGKPHWEACKGNETQNITYCQKENDYVMWGFPKPIKIIEKLYPWQKMIEDIYHEEPDDRTIYWFWETKGNVGKSAFIKYMAVKHKILLCTGGKYSDIMNLVFNQDMNECKCVCFDIPRSHHNSISYASLESIKNGMVCNTKYETGMKIFNSPHIFVFANFEPDMENLSYDRWKVQELNMPDLQTETI